MLNYSVSVGEHLESLHQKRLLSVLGEVVVPLQCSEGNICVSTLRPMCKKYLYHFEILHTNHMLTKESYQI